MSLVLDLNFENGSSWDAVSESNLEIYDNCIQNVEYNSTNHTIHFSDRVGILIPNTQELGWPLSFDRGDFAYKIKLKKDLDLSMFSSSYFCLWTGYDLNRNQTEVMIYENSLAVGYVGRPISYTYNFTRPISTWLNDGAFHTITFTRENDLGKVYFDNTLEYQQADTFTYNLGNYGRLFTRTNDNPNYLKNVTIDYIKIWKDESTSPGLTNKIYNNIYINN